MSKRPFCITIATWSQDQEALHAVRFEVFIHEQSVPEDEEWDALDPHCEHVLARDERGNPIGCGRLSPDGRIGRMAVLATWRGHAVGKALLTYLLDRARQLNWGVVLLSSQTHALDFYSRAGFVAYGDTYIDAGIPHRMMRRILEPATGKPSVVPLHPCPTRRDTLAAWARRLQECQHRLFIFSRDLDPGFLDTPPIVLQLRHLALRGRGVEIRMLIQNPESVQRHGHPLIELIQRLPTAIRVRVPVEKEDLANPAAFLLNDHQGFLWRQLGYRFEAQTSASAPGRHAELSGYFDQVWERAVPTVQFRALEL